jgi:hypothetical protein
VRSVCIAERDTPSGKTYCKGSTAPQLGSRSSSEVGFLERARLASDFAPNRAKFRWASLNETELGPRRRPGSPLGKKLCSHPQISNSEVTVLKPLDGQVARFGLLMDLEV